MMRVLTTLALAGAMLFPACKDAPPPAAETDAAVQTIYLVRHAEKQKGDNPRLTEAGEARAELLRDMLLDKGVSHIHSTNLRRTLETALPLSKALDLEIKIYDPSDLPGFAAELKTQPGTHLVVGHSNTTPELTGFLLGQEIKPMPETEYDRFTKVTLGKDGAAQDLELSRFGAGN